MTLLGTNDSFTLNNFIIYQLDNEHRELVVMHNSGIVKVKEERLINCLKYWDQNNIKKTTKEYLVEKFGSDTDRVISFLQANSIFIEEKEFNYDIKSFIFMTNSEDIFISAKSLFFDETARDSDVLLINEQCNLKSYMKPNSLFIVFLNPYNKKRAKQIRDSVREIEGSVLLMSYVYNNNFYIDSFYFPYLYNPCHLCHIGHIESQLRVDSTGNTTYQQIIDSIYFDEPTFPIHAVLSNNNILNILSLLNNKLAKFITLESGNVIFPEELHECTMLDLQTNKLVTDYSLHWELCDCYE